MGTVTLKTEFGLLEQVDLIRKSAGADLPNQTAYGQFFTPAPIARLMASLPSFPAEEIRLLDPGSGVGILTAAVVNELCGRARRPRRIAVTLFEIDPNLHPYLSKTLQLCEELCTSQGIAFDIEGISEDFVDGAASLLESTLFSPIDVPLFNACILNPPYRKVNSDSRAALKLRGIGVDTANLYTAFLDLSEKLLDEQGEIVSITPRSFCNGTYFKSFRKSFFSKVRLRKVHLFESRNAAFADDAVLQENLIICGLKSRAADPLESIEITSSDGPELHEVCVNSVTYDRVIGLNDPDAILHIETSPAGALVSDALRSLDSSFDRLGFSVSTGQIVDFRLAEHLRETSAPNTVPLLYPQNFRDGELHWPLDSKKSNAIICCPETAKWLMPAGHYVVIKRFSSKEERKRIVATLLHDKDIPAAFLGFENHLNLVHQDGGGIEDEDLAKGVCAFLNSTIVDSFFRQFSGHTQVNAADLRNIPLPDSRQLVRLGEVLGRNPSQHDIDSVINSSLFEDTPNMKKNASLAVQRKQKLEQALEAIRDLDLPREQQNERTALSLLALCDIRPDQEWAKASGPRIGITPIMEFISAHYGKKYAPNTRETIRRFSVHQMIDAGIVIANPDNPSRPPNSPKTVYVISELYLKALRQFGKKGWKEELAEIRKTSKSLREKYARERETRRIPVQISPGRKITLSPGGQNVLVQQVLEDFAPCYTPGGKVLYVGDTDEKFAHFDEPYLRRLGVTIDKHGKMPDVILHYTTKNWLVLIEAVTSHGPINAKRRGELQGLFAKSKAGLVYVTAFLDRRSMTKYLPEISWSTEVWVAESPTHLIHFNGERFLGPYQD